MSWGLRFIMWSHFDTDTACWPIYSSSGTASLLLYFFSTESSESSSSCHLKDTFNMKVKIREITAVVPSATVSTKKSRGFTQKWRGQRAVHVRSGKDKLVVYLSIYYIYGSLFDWNLGLWSPFHRAQSFIMQSLIIMPHLSTCDDCHSRVFTSVQACVDSKIV